MSEYAEQFIELCLECDNYSSKAGVKKHNKAVKALSKLYNKIALDKEVAESIYDKLMDHNDERVRSTAAAHSLGLNVNLTKAQKVLKEIMQNSPEPLSSFNAEMTLQVWKEQGYLKF